MWLAEIFDTEVPLQWQRESPSRYVADFDIADEQFYVQLDILEEPDARFGFVIFGKYDENGAGSVKRVNSKKPTQVFSIVSNGIIKLASKLGLNVVAYTAKEIERHDLYLAIGKRLSKKLNMPFESRVKGQVGLFIIAKKELTKSESEFITRKMKDLPKDKRIKK